METLIYGFGSWSLGYWLALTFRLGWHWAVAFAVVFAVVVVWLAWRWRAPDTDAPEQQPDVVPLTLLLAFVLVWPIALEVDRSVLFGVALGLFVVRAIVPFVRGGANASDVRLAGLVAIAVGCTAAYWFSWTAMVVALCAIALVAVARPHVVHRLTASDEPARSTTRDAPRAARAAPWFEASLAATLAATLVLVALGLLIAVWWVGIDFWSSDNTYYLNKAAQYAHHGAAFPIRDYLFGFRDAQHYPFGDIFSTFEPLLGVGSAISGVSPASLLFRVVVPGATFLLPFSARYGARGLGVRRANLVGGIAAATVLLMTGTNTASLFATASYGKTVGALVMVPLLIGTVGTLLRRKDRGSALLATMAAVSTVAFSPTLALAATVILVPFTAVALWELRPRRRADIGHRVRPMVAMAAPLLFVGGYALITRIAQQRAGSSQLIAGLLASGPKQAWELAFTYHRGSFLTYAFIVGSIALLPLVLRSSLLARGFGALILLFFGVVFSPWLFGTIVKRVPDLHYFAWRIPWGLPAGLFIGIAVAALDRRRQLGIVTLTAVLVVMGLSGPDLSKSFFPVAADVRHAPTWPWERGIPASLRKSARAIARVTPKDRRFLAPPSIEEVATALETDRFPVYARLHYVTAVGTADHVPRDFFASERELLAQGMSGTAKTVPVETWQRALARVDVATVCTDDTTVAALRQAVRQRYVRRGSAPSCVVWTRDTTRP